MCLKTLLYRLYTADTFRREQKVLVTPLLIEGFSFFWFGRKMNVEIVGTKKPNRVKRDNEGASRRRPEGRMK